jgi:glycosyltransferase involved in cell wall biosynthesis
LFEDFLGRKVESRGYPSALVPTLALALMDLGHDVTVITTAIDVHDMQIYESPHLRLIIVPSRARARDRALSLFSEEVKNVRNALRLFEFDVIHAHWTYEFALAASGVKNVPVLITAHDAPFTVLRYVPDAYRFFRLLLALRARLKIRNLSVVSPYLADKWKSSMFYKREINVVPNPVAAAKPLETNLSQTTRQEQYFIEIADASPRKNVKLLLRAYAMFRAKNPGVNLHLVGDGLSGNDPLFEWAKRRGLTSGVLFLGRLEHNQVMKELSQAVAIVHVSKEESNPLVLIEALVAGVSIIAGAKSGGTAWTVFFERGARLVDVNSTDEVARAMKDLSEVRKGEISQDLLWLVRHRYAPEVVAASYVEIYFQIIKDREANARVARAAR